MSSLSFLFLLLPFHSSLLFCQENACGPVIQSFPEPNQSLFLWLLDLCVDVSSYSSINKMTAQNLAICISPNLFHANDQNPMEGLKLAQKVAQFMRLAILWRTTWRKSKGISPPALKGKDGEIVSSAMIQQQQQNVTSPNTPPSPFSPSSPVP